MSFFVRSSLCLLGGISHAGVVCTPSRKNATLVSALSRLVVVFDRAEIFDRTGIPTRWTPPLLTLNETSSGRVDALDPSAVTPDGRLPNADSGPPGTDPTDSAHLRTIFYRMGFDDREIVALSGAHALGRCHTTASGFDGPWTPTPTTFNNLYFTFLKQVNWTKRDWSGPFQYEDGSKKFMMLPTDLALIKDSKFKKYVDIYAKDQATFFADFSKAFKKLEELGTANLKATEWA